MLITKNKLKVRNLFEKEVADFFYENKLNFIYKPYINIGNKAYFPDFIVGHTIIGVTAWKHPDKLKISYLKNKVINYISWVIKLFFIYQKNIGNFIKILMSLLFLIK